MMLLAVTFLVVIVYVLRRTYISAKSYCFVRKMCPRSRPHVSSRHGETVYAPDRSDSLAASTTRLVFVGNFAQAERRFWPIAASATSPLLNRCCSKYSGKNLRGRSPRKSSPMPPRNFGARKMFTNSAAALPTSWICPTCANRRRLWPRCQAGIHRGARGLEIVGNGFSKSVETLLHRIELLLEHQQRLVWLGPATRNQHGDRDQGEHTEDDHRDFHAQRLHLFNVASQPFN